MILYHTDKYGRYNGRQSNAKLNPNYNIDTHVIADKYIYNPRTESLIEPFGTGENEACQLKDKTWVKVVDRIGQNYYEQDGTKVKIEELAIDVPAGSIQSEPDSEYHDTHDGLEWIEDPLKELKEWEKDMVEMDKNMPRYMENHLRDEHNGNCKDEVMQAKFNAKIKRRSEQPNK